MDIQKGKPINALRHSSQCETRALPRMTRKLVDPWPNSKEAEERKSQSVRFPLGLPNLLRIIFVLICISVALAFTVAAHREWMERRVATSLVSSSNKPLAELHPPTFTICTPPPSLRQVKAALASSFVRWRLDKKKSLNKDVISLLVKEFLEEKFQIRNQPFNFLDVFSALFASEDFDISFGVKEYLKECPVTGHLTRNKRSGILNLIYIQAMQGSMAMGALLI